MKLSSCKTSLLAVFLMTVLNPVPGHGDDFVVTSEAEMNAALDSAGPGDRILLAPGTYTGGFFQSGLSGVVIRSQLENNPAILNGGSNGIQLSDATNVTIEHLVFRNQTDNGLNIDDGGTFASPSTNITLTNLTVRDITTGGNRDGIKLSGVTGFLIDRVRVETWGDGGSAIDMVGCHHGLIQNSLFRHDSISALGSGVRPKGGSKDITIRANRFDMADGRAIQAGGSTGSQFFRFIDGDSGYEARQIRVEGNVVDGGSSSFSFVNIDGGNFHHNFAHRPRNWFIRILNENPGAEIVDTQNGRMADNVMVFNDTATEFNTAVNIGSETLPETFTFAGNQWYNLADPNSSEPTLPSTETNGVYGVLPTFENNEAVGWQFDWGVWIVNANDAADNFNIDDPELFHVATPGIGSQFDPLTDNPFIGQWTFSNLKTNSIALPPFTQCFLSIPPVRGDVNGDGTINLLDVAPFVSAVSTGTYIPAADINQDRVVNLLDVDPFVDLLTF